MVASDSGTRFIMSAPDPRQSPVSEDKPYSAGNIGSSTLELLEEADAYNAWIFSKIAPYLGARNLELGAGQGTLSRHALDGHSVVLCEPSSDSRRVLQRRFGNHERALAIVEDLAALKGHENFDCIYSANVLEHVIDDVHLLEQAAPLLQPGGHFVAVVPAHRWLYSKFDARLGHHRRYAKDDVERLERAIVVAGLGLELVEFRHFNPVGAVAWLVRMRLLRKKAIAPKDARLMNRLVPLLMKLDRLPLPFGQSLVLCYKRSP